MSVVQSRMDDRTKSAIGAAVVNGAIGYALIMGLGIDLPSVVRENLAVFDIAPAPPPPVEKIAPHPVKSKKPEGAASPPNLRAKATEIVAPPPIVPLMVPPPIVAALKPGSGRDAFAGAADIRGPGTGSGGQGNGTGNGDSGYGDGDGGDEIPPHRLKGRLKDSDYPRSAGEAGVGGKVSVRYVVTTAGRAADCEITRSSGFPDLDATTCRLIQQRFRFNPSRDARGRPVNSTLIEDHDWIIHQEPPERR